MISPGDLLKSLAKEGALSPQEQLMEVGKKGHKLFIGIPKETSFQENRVALVPSAVAVLVNNGHEVLVETGAGKKMPTFRIMIIVKPELKFVMKQSRFINLISCLK